MKTKLNIGDRITVKADEYLGTPEAIGTVRAVYEDSYSVHIDGDDEIDWEGEVDHDGNLLNDGY